jgi:hypothetical protein
MATQTATRTSTTPRIYGPASYFPSIERTYGESIEHWIELIHAHAPAKHLELVNWLKIDYGLGHGHANALVAHALGARAQ